MNVNMLGISMDHLTHCDAHVHSQWEIVVCLRGRGLLRVGNFTSLINVLYESFFSNEVNNKQIVSALWDVMYQLLSGWCDGAVYNQAVKKLVHTMILNVSNTEFDLSEYLNHYGYSVDHLRRCFKKEMSLTPTAYMIKLRMEHACRILELPQQGGYSIKQIAYLSGFSDPYYFSNTFKKHMGCSPREYKKGYNA